MGSVSIRIGQALRTLSGPQEAGSKGLQAVTKTLRVQVCDLEGTQETLAQGWQYASSPVPVA